MILWGKDMLKIQKRLYKLSCILLCMILFCVLTPLNASAEESVSTTTDNDQSKPNVIRVGWYEDSYHITNKNGDRSGYGYEYEQVVSAYTGWNYEYINGDWSELVEKLLNGEIDMMSGISYTDERAKTMLFSDESMGEEKYYLYADLVNSDISASDLSSLNGKSIGMIEQSVQATQFYKWEENNHIYTKHVYVDSIDSAKEMLKNHEIQGIISAETSIWVENGLSAIVTTGGSDIHFGINKNRPDLKEELDNAMRSMLCDKPFYADELYSQYIATQSVATLSNDEKEWLKQRGVIRIGYLKEDPGFSATDSKTGKLTGVVNDYMDYAKNCLGQKLDFEIVGFDTQEDQILALKNDKIDMIFHINQNPYYAEKNNISLSNTVLSVPLAVVTSEEGFDESEENTIAIPKENAKFKWYVSYNYPNWKIIECDSLEAAGKMVQEDQADCLIVRAGQATHFLGDTKLHCTFLTKSANSSFGVLKGNTVLLSILNKTLKSIQTSKLTGAVSMYEDSLKKVTITDFIKDNLLVVASAFLGRVVLIVTVILRLLKKAKNAEKTAKEAQKQAEIANAAKSTFLFNMSHDIRTPMNALLGYNQLMKKELTDPKLLHYQEKMEHAGNILLSILNNVLDLARIESGKMELDENYEEVGNILHMVCEVFESSAKKKNIQFVCESQVEHNHIMCDATKVQEIFTNLISNAGKYTASGGQILIKSMELPCDKEGFVRIKTEVADNGIGMSKDFLPLLFDPFAREKNTTLGKVAGTGLGMPIVKRLIDMMGGSIEVESELGKGTKVTVILEHKIADERYYKPKSDNEKNLEMHESLQGKHILLAEDNELNAEIAITILEDMGLKLEWVEDGIQCVSKMEQMPAGTYDLILMDIQMPNMDGYKATQTIRRLADKDKADIPIVAMTANAFKEDEEKAFSVGMNGHIGKPIDVEKVEEVLCSILR